MFQVTPHWASDVNFHVTYENGNNEHSADLVMSLNLGANKAAAVPLINNIALTEQGAANKMTGDATNAGITDARGVVMTVVPPAHPIEPYTLYAVGLLAAGDFSSFTLTFAAGNLTGVPVEVTWKDAGGNSFSTVQTLDIRSFANTTAGSSQRAIFPFGDDTVGGFSRYYLVIAFVIVLTTGIIIWLARRHREG